MPNILNRLDVNMIKVIFFFEHDLLPKPVSTPDQVRGRLFGSCSSGSIRNPLGALHLLQLVLVDVRQDVRDERTPDLYVGAGIRRLSGDIAAAVHDAARWQLDRGGVAADGDEAREADRVLADRPAQQVVVALPHCGADVAHVMHVPNLAFARDPVPLIEKIRGGEYGLARSVVAELKQQERSRIINGVVQAPPRGYFEIVEHRE